MLGAILEWVGRCEKNTHLRKLLLGKLSNIEIWGTSGVVAGAVVFYGWVFFVRSHREAMKGLLSFWGHKLLVCMCV